MSSQKQNVANSYKAILSVPSDVWVLDTETTGVDDGAEIIELSVIDGNGKVIIDTLVKPVIPIPRDATDIHGITNEMVADAPHFIDVLFTLFNKMSAHGSPVTFAIYNAEFDVRLLEQSSELALASLSESEWHRVSADVENIVHAIEQSAWCVMKDYAAFYGDWNEHRKNYRWQKLTDAAKQCGVTGCGTAHRALADCRMTLGVMRKMAGYTENRANRQNKPIYTEKTKPYQPKSRGSKWAMLGVVVLAGLILMLSV